MSRLRPADEPFIADVVAAVEALMEPSDEFTPDTPIYRATQKWLRQRRRPSIPKGTWARIMREAGCVFSAQTDLDGNRNDLVRGVQLRTH